MEGRAAARHVRRGEAARGRAFADRARRQRRGHIARPVTAGRRIPGSPKSPSRPPENGRRKLARDNAPAECAHDHARDRRARQRAAAAARDDGSVWPLRNTWNRATENLYSAWIEKLFDAPLDATLSWPALHEVLRDRSRNFLFNHLGLNEDSMKMFIRPDCADLPYFLRAYFAFKMGLPFGYAKCTRGGAGEPPKCFAWWNIQNLEPLPPPAEEVDRRPRRRRRPAPPIILAVQLLRPGRRAAGGNADADAEGASRAAAKPQGPPPKPAGLAPAFGWYLRIVADGVHSGSGRTARPTTTTITIRCR